MTIDILGAGPEGATAAALDETAGGGAIAEEAWTAELATGMTVVDDWPERVIVRVSAEVDVETEAAALETGKTVVVV